MMKYAVNGHDHHLQIFHLDCVIPGYLKNKLKRALYLRVELNTSSGPPFLPEWKLSLFSIFSKSRVKTPETGRSRPPWLYPSPTIFRLVIKSNYYDPEFQLVNSYNCSNN